MQEHLHFVQSEFEKQRQMDTLELGKHLAANLDVVKTMLQEQVENIRQVHEQCFGSGLLFSALVNACIEPFIRGITRSLKGVRRIR